MNSYLRIQGHDIKIIFDSTLNKQKDATGTFSGNILQITIDPTFSGSQQIATLIHEIIEALNYFLNMELEHHKISLLEAGLFQIFNDNREELKRILEKIEIPQ